jgi:pimeloyl-ACP methyl ester carboxylesterase
VGLLTLARWLGPWADATKAPPVVSFDERVGGTRVRVYGERHRSAFLVAPGLHYAGPDDPRMDRFCRVLAASGHLVIAPFIADYLALVPGRGAIDEFARVFEHWRAERPVVFSISFGSLLSFALAADVGDAIERLVVFGGYADFQETLRFCMTGEVASGRKAVRDPLNQPVVLMNLLDHIAHPPEHRVALEAAWRRYVERTWGRVEMKANCAFVAVAEELAPSVPEPVRELFLIGVGALPGAWELAQPALERIDVRVLDPTPYLARVRGRVELVHGADDDVIPFEHAHALAKRLTAADVRVHVTGMYGHSGASMSRLAALPRELATMVRVLRVLAR